MIRMRNIEEAYQFSLRVEENLNKNFEIKQSGRSNRLSYGGRNEDQEKKDEASSSQN